MAGSAKDRATRAPCQSHAKATCAATDPRASALTAITHRNVTDVKTRHNRLRAAEEMEAGLTQTTKLRNKACKAHQVVG